MLGTMALLERPDAAHLTPPAPKSVRPADPADRERHIEAWKARFFWGRPVAVIAAAFGVSPQAVHLWLKKANAYPETAAIRGSNAYRRAQGNPAR